MLFMSHWDSSLGLFPESVNGVLQLPLAALALPDVVRSPTVNYFRKLFVRDIAKLEEIFIVFFRKFTVVPFDEANPFFASNLPIPDLMSRIGCSSPYSKFYECQIIVKAIDAIIDAGVLRVGAFG